MQNTSLASALSLGAALESLGSLEVGFAWRCSKAIKRNLLSDRLVGDTYRQAPSASKILTCKHRLMGP